MRIFRDAADGRLGPFILVVEGSIPNEKNKEEGYWASFGTDSATGQPITTCEWIDRLAPKAWAVVAAGTCATYGGIHAMEGNPTGCMGLPDYLGWSGNRKWHSHRLRSGMSVQPDNFMETLLYLLHMAAGRAPMIPLDEALRPTWLFGATVHEGCDRGGYYEQAQFAEEYGSPKLHREAGMLGPGRAVQRGQARMDGRYRWLSERGRHLHRLHDAGFSRQVHAVHEPAAGFIRCLPVRWRLEGPFTRCVVLRRRRLTKSRAGGGAGIQIPELLESLARGDRCSPRNRRTPIVGPNRDASKRHECDAPRWASQPLRGSAGKSRERARNSQ